MRRLPWVTLLVPLVLSAILNSGAARPVRPAIMETATDFTTFGSCWLLGMAHQEGLLRRIPQYVVPSLAPLVAGAGFWWLQQAPVDDRRSGPDLEAVPLAQAIWSFGCVMLLLHLSPSWERWPDRLERFNGVITLLNSRAVTVYLWHCVALVYRAADRPPVEQPLLLRPPALAAVQPVAAAAVAIAADRGRRGCFGWVEDAARRRPRLWPDGRTGTHRA